MRSCPCSNVCEKYESSHWLPFGQRPSREEWLISVITNGNILYLVTFKWLLTGAYGLPHTINTLTQYISYFNCLVYHVCRLYIFITILWRPSYQYSPYIKPNYTMLVTNSLYMWLPWWLKWMKIHGLNCWASMPVVVLFVWEKRVVMRCTQHTRVQI